MKEYMEIYDALNKYNSCSKNFIKRFFLKRKIEELKNDIIRELSENFLTYDHLLDFGMFIALIKSSDNRESGDIKLFYTETNSNYSIKFTRFSNNAIRLTIYFIGDNIHIDIDTSSVIENIIKVNCKYQDSYNVYKTHWYSKDFRDSLNYMSSVSNTDYSTLANVLRSVNSLTRMAVTSSILTLIDGYIT